MLVPLRVYPFSTKDKKMGQMRMLVKIKNKVNLSNVDKSARNSTLCRLAFPQHTNVNPMTQDAIGFGGPTRSANREISGTPVPSSWWKSTLGDNGL